MVSDCGVCWADECTADGLCQAYGYHNMLYKLSPARLLCRWSEVGAAHGRTAPRWCRADEMCKGDGCAADAGCTAPSSSPAPSVSHTPSISPPCAQQHPCAPPSSLRVDLTLLIRGWCQKSVYMLLMASEEGKATVAQSRKTGEATPNIEVLNNDKWRRPLRVLNFSQ